MGSSIRISVISGALVALLVAATPAFAVHARDHHKAQKSRKAHYRHVVWNPILRAPAGSQLRQNEEVDRLQLPRIADDTQLEELEHNQELVQVRETKALRISPVIDANKRYLRPWANQFIVDMSEAYYNQFHVPLQLNSAVRTMEQQYKLRFHNRNAAPEAGETASSHLAGITMDLAKRGLSRSQHAFVVDYLKGMRDQGLVEAIEERRTHCFHVMVSDRYTDWRETKQVADNIVQE
ncbi:MAG TPA: DUF5715 family protein [Verrucomicrobiae bacterium]|jgi:hypothetical protein|nr:DUF5715 family protein [Verrucomicrobiae bacterium]